MEGEQDEEGNTLVLSLERKSVQPYKTQDEYLYAMKEDLAEWFNTLYDLEITVDDFFEQHEKGVVLCQHANNVQSFILECYRRKSCPGNIMPPPNLPEEGVQYRTNVKPGSFQSRDNIANFIGWCRGLGIPDCLLFETDDLVLRKNERNVVLCMLEVARRGAKYGMPAPVLIQLEEEIDAEIAGEEPPPRPEPPPAAPVPFVQRQTCDLMSLDEMVRAMLSKCNCPDQFPMIRVSEGKYKIGDSQTLIFVRILRNHVMVRIGGGWDTLENYLDRHDPCRCKALGHRIGRGSSPQLVQTNVQVKRRVSTPSNQLSGLEVKTKTVVRDATSSEIHAEESRRSKKQHTPQPVSSNSALAAQRRVSLATSTPSRLVHRQPSASSRQTKTPGVSPNLSRENSDLSQTDYIPRAQSPATVQMNRTLRGAPLSDIRKLNTPVRPTSAREMTRKGSTSSTDSMTGPSQPARDTTRGRSTDRRTIPTAVTRSRSVDGRTARRELFSKTTPASNSRDLNLVVTRDETGRHKIDPMGNKPKGTGVKVGQATRVNISPEKILPNKLKCLPRSKTIDDPMVNGNSSPDEMKSPDSSSSLFSVSCDFENYPEAPPENAELHQHMELLFQEYRKIELGIKDGETRDSVSPPSDKSPVKSQTPKAQTPRAMKPRTTYRSNSADDMLDGPVNRGRNTTPKAEAGQTMTRRREGTPVSPRKLSLAGQSPNIIRSQSVNKSQPSQDTVQSSKPKDNGFRFRSQSRDRRNSVEVKPVSRLANNQTPKENVSNTTPRSTASQISRIANTPQRPKSAPGFRPSNMIARSPSPSLVSSSLARPSQHTQNVTSKPHDILVVSRGTDGRHMISHQNPPVKPNPVKKPIVPRDSPSMQNTPRTNQEPLSSSSSNSDISKLVNQNQTSNSCRPAANQRSLSKVRDRKEPLPQKAISPWRRGSPVQNGHNSDESDDIELITQKTFQLTDNNTQENAQSKGSIPNGPPANTQSSRVHVVYDGAWDSNEKDMSPTRNVTPTQNMTPKRTPAKSAWNASPAVATPNKASARSSSVARMRSNSQDDLLDGGSRGRSESRSRNGQAVPQSPMSARKYPRGTSSFRSSQENITKNVPSAAIRPQQRSLSATNLCKDQPLQIYDQTEPDLDLMKSKELRVEVDPAIIAKPRKDTRATGRTKIPVPTSMRSRRASDDFPTLKRFDSGVDINNMSPTESSIHGDDEPWHESGNVCHHEPADFTHACRNTENNPEYDMYY